MMQNSIKGTEVNSHKLNLSLRLKLRDQDGRKLSHTLFKLMKSFLVLWLALQSCQLLCAKPSDTVSPSVTPDPSATAKTSDAPNPAVSPHPSVIAKTFLCYIYGKEIHDIQKICSGNEDVWMLKGAPNPTQQMAVLLEPINIEATGVFMGVIERDICVVELRDGKVDPSFNLQTVHTQHHELIRYFLSSALLQDKERLARVTTNPENISFGGVPKAARGEMGQYSDVLAAIPILRISSKESDAKSHSITYRLPLGKNGFNLKLVLKDKTWLIDSQTKIDLPLRFFFE